MVEIYSVGRAIQPMNNPGQTVMVTSKVRGIPAHRLGFLLLRKNNSHYKLDIREGRF